MQALMCWWPRAHASHRVMRLQGLVKADDVIDVTERVQLQTGQTRVKFALGW